MRTNAENRRAHPLLLQDRRHKMTEKTFESEVSQRQWSFWKEKSKSVRGNPSRSYERAHNSRDRSAACTSQKVPDATEKSGKKGSVARFFFCILNLMSVAFTFLNLRTGLKKQKPMKQERCGRRDAGEMAKSTLKLQEKDKATFFSLSDVWCLPAPFSAKPEER